MNKTIRVIIKRTALFLALLYLTACTGSTDSSGGKSISLSWTPPTQNTDGSALTDLSGYILYYGTSSDKLDQSISLSNPGLASYTIDGSLLNGQKYYVSLVAVNSLGIPSPHSKIVSN